MRLATTTTVADRLLVVAGRLRERAVATKTFDPELAVDLEELASIAAIVADVYADLRKIELATASSTPGSC